MLSAYQLEIQNKILDAISTYYYDNNGEHPSKIKVSSHIYSVIRVNQICYSPKEDQFDGLPTSVDKNSHRDFIEVS